MRARRRLPATIRARLFVGFAAVLALLGAAAVAEWYSTASLARNLGQRLTTVQLDAQFAAQLAMSVKQALDAGEHYTEHPDSGSQAAFRGSGWDAHRLVRALERQPEQTPNVLGLLSIVDDSLSMAEAAYARAHRLVDLGRVADAGAVARRARATAEPLLATLDQLGKLEARSVAQAAIKLQDGSTERSILLIAAISIALAIATAVVLGTVRSITEPLEALVAHAKGLSAGDLTVRTSRQLPGEFQILGSAMNQLSGSLSRIVAVTTTTADDVAASANELSSVSEQISLSANQMAGAMAEVSEGAEGQVQQLRTVDGALRSVREGAEGVRAGAADVHALATRVEQSAAEKRAQVEHALTALLEVKGTVQHAFQHVASLDAAATEINGFVSSVSRIAEQTNLLALNAAIAAARAGPAGKGFAIVAEEIRALALQAETAAADIVAITAMITQRVANTTDAMTRGVSRVAEIERVSRGIDEALSGISSASEQMRAAASTVTRAAGANAVAVEQASGGLAAIAGTAEGHAAAAQQVSASTEEQSAACEQMASASASLLEGSKRLRQLVGGLKAQTT
jgi:methyl-accepting chemotaxis protein